MLSLLSFQSLVFGESSQAMPHSSPPAAMPNKNVTPTARTCSELNGVYVTGEFIYWKARQEELVYGALTDFDFDLTTGDPSLVAEPQEIDFQYDPGFKLGLGGDLPFDGWDLYLNWTRFHNRISSSLTSDENNIFAFFGGSIGDLPGPPFLGRSAKGSWNLMFNSLDFDWGRRFYLSKTLSIRPSFGGKAVWIHQKFNYSVQDTEGIIVNIPGNPETYKLKNDFWGIGPYFAFDGKWTFGWGFGLYGEISSALLWGKFEQKARIVRNLFVPFEAIDFVRRIDFEAHRVRPTAQAFIGFDWEWCFIPKWLSLNFRIGYETQYFWSQLVNPTEGLEESDLTFEGLTFMGRIDF